MQSLIEIKSLICKYPVGNKVLELSNINFEKGKLYFLLGLSGSGKSTLLETIGLMNDPIDKNNKNEILYNTTHGLTIDILSLWNSSDVKISNFRKANYSFIFQNTNLMPSFTAGENMTYTLLLEGINTKEAKTKVLKVMDDLLLDKNIFDKSIQNLSGGQRQRISFVRAFVSPFEVLFGDEPTGNLDAITGNSLMTLLKTHLSENNKTGIIVSHDISIALKYADEILMINRIEDSESETSYGYLGMDNILSKRNEKWYFIRSENKIENEYVTIHNFLK